MKKMLLLFALIVSCLFCISFANAENQLVIWVDCVEASEIVVSVRISANPGVNSIGFEVAYDAAVFSYDHWETDGTIFSQEEIDAYRTGSKVVVSAITVREDLTGTGEMMKLFFFPKNASEGQIYEFLLRAGAFGGATNLEEQRIPVSFGNGTLTKGKATIHNKTTVNVSSAKSVAAPSMQIIANYDSIRYMKGRNKNTFEADAPASRYEVLDALNYFCIFSDIGENCFFSDLTDNCKTVVNHFFSAGIIQGFPDGTFRGDNSVTRAQLVKILTLLLQIHEENSPTTFSDIEGHWAQKSVRAFEKTGYLSGYPDGTFRPDQPILRGEFVTILNRVFSNKNTPTEQLPYLDLPSSHWAFPDIAKACLDY